MGGLCVSGLSSGRGGQVADESLPEEQVRQLQEGEAQPGQPVMHAQKGQSKQDFIIGHMNITSCFIGKRYGSPND